MPAGSQVHENRIVAPAGTATTVEDTVQQNMGYQGILCFLNIASGSGTVQVDVFCDDGLGNKKSVANTGALAIAGSPATLLVFPGVTNSASQPFAQNYSIGYNYHVKATVVGTVAYSLVYDLIP